MFVGVERESQAWTGYWSRGFERSAAFVSQAGGQAFCGGHGYNHALWHAVFCGLGDFGGDKGFAWDDRAAFRWATTPEATTNPRPLPYHYRGGYYLEETHDGIHPIAPTDLPEYNRLVRDRVMSVVRADPLWYAGIVLRRIGAILGHATPAALTIGVAQLLAPGIGWLLVPILLVLGFLKRAFEVKLILFTLPLSAVALLVYSGCGMTAYGIAHLIALAVALDLLIEPPAPRPPKEEPMAAELERSHRPTLCVVSPCFNEAVGGIRAFHEALRACWTRCRISTTASCWWMTAAPTRPCRS